MSDAEQSLIGFDIEQAARIFDAGADFVAQIADQNERFTEAQRIFAEDEQIREIVSEGIAEEQAETFAKQRDLTTETGYVYRSFGESSLEVERELLQNSDDVIATEELLTQNRQELEQKKQEKESQLQEDARSIVDNVARLSPKALERVQELLAARMAEAVSDAELLLLEAEIGQLAVRLELLQGKQDRLERQSSNFDDICAKHGGAWPVPLALASHALQTAAIEAVIDELPVEPVLTPRVHEKYDELRTRHIDQPEATLYSALYLSERRGEIVTVDELIDFLYPPAVIRNVSDHLMRARVTTVLGPEKGVAVRQILEEDGLVLQYGWRRRLEKNGGGTIIVTERKRIYRALPISVLETMANETIEGENYRDEFEVTPGIKEHINFSRLIAKTIRNMDFSHPASADLDETNTPETTDLPPVHGDKPVPAQPAEAEPAAHQPVRPVRAPAKGNNGASKKATAETGRSGTWEKDFKVEVGRTLDELFEHGLLSNEEGERLGTARTKMGSARFGTQRSLQRLASAGLISRDFEAQIGNLSNLLVTPEVMVLLKLHTTCKDLAKGNPHQRRAQQLIRQAVSSFFEHHRDDASDAQS